MPAGGVSRVSVRDVHGQEGGAQVANSGDEAVQLCLVGDRASQDGGAVVGVGEGEAVEPCRPVLREVTFDAELVVPGRLL